MFKLNIECSKDISELHINFTDGTSAVVETSNTPKKTESVKQISNRKNRENSVKNEAMLEPEELIVDKYHHHETVKLPEIQVKNRPVNVAAELQNLDI